MDQIVIMPLSSVPGQADDVGRQGQARIARGILVDLLHLLQLRESQVLQTLVE